MVWLLQSFTHIQSILQRGVATPSAKIQSVKCRVEQLECYKVHTVVEDSAVRILRLLNLNRLHLLQCSQSTQDTGVATPCAKNRVSWAGTEQLGC